MKPLYLKRILPAGAGGFFANVDLAAKVDVGQIPCDVAEVAYCPDKTANRLFACYKIDPGYVILRMYMRFCRYERIWDHELAVGIVIYDPANPAK